MSEETSLPIKKKPHLYQKLLSRKKILPKDPWLPEEVSTKSFSLEKNPTKRSLTAWGSLYQKLLSRKNNEKKSYQKIPDCLRKSLPKASLKKKNPTKRSLTAWGSLYQKLLSRKVPTKRSLTAWGSLYLPKASQEKFLPKDLWLPEQVSTKSFSRKVPTKRSLTAWGSLYQKLLSRKKILPKDPWLPEEVSTKSFSLEKNPTQWIPDCLRKFLPKFSL